MATKPLTLPRQWATLANYDTGPFIGQPMKVNPGVGIAASGHRPGAAFPTPAEYENFQQNQITAVWIPWVNAGSFAGAADAHLVETAATGRSALVGLTLTDAVDEVVLNVTTTAATIVPAIAVDATAATGGGISVACSANATSYDTTIGAGNGVGYSAILSASGATAAGVLVSSTGLNNGDGVRINMGAGSGYGVFSTSASTSPAGSFNSTGVGLALDADATGGTSPTSASFSGGTSRVIRATASAAAIAAEFIGGSTAGTGAVTARTTNNTGAVIAASVPNTATSAARGFYCSTGTSGAMAAEFVSSGSGGSGNFALQVSGDTSSPTLGTINIIEQNARPTTGLSGHLTSINSASLKLGLCGGYSDNTWRSYWATLNGYACAYGDLPNTSTLGGIGVWKVVGTITTSSVGNEVKVASSTVLLRVSMTPRAVTIAATGPTLGVLVEDTTAGTTVYQRVNAGTGDTTGFKMPDNVNIWQNSIAFMVPVVVPAIGTRSYRLSITTSSATEIRVRDVTMDFVGSVD